MKITCVFAVLSIALLSVAGNATDNKPITRYSFENRFSTNAKNSVEIVKQKYGDVSEDEMNSILDDISFSSSCINDFKQGESIKRCRELGFGVISALERATHNPDSEIRRRVTWLASYMVFRKELRKSDYPIIEEALSWLFCRMILDVDDKVRDEASIGLLCLVSYRIPNSPIPQGALEGIWLYKLITPYSEEYSKRMDQFNQYKIPDISAEFMRIWVDYEIQKVGVDASMKKKQNNDAKPIETGK